MNINKISQYLQSDSRNKIVFLQHKQQDIPCIDIGYLLADKLNKLNNKKHISFQAEEIVDDLMNSSILDINPFGTIRCLENMGILFEKELKFNFQLFLDKYSRDIPLFISWSGQIDNNTLYFLSKEMGLKIDIKGLSHIII